MVQITSCYVACYRTKHWLAGVHVKNIAWTIGVRLVTTSLISIYIRVQVSELEWTPCWPYIEPYLSPTDERSYRLANFLIEVCFGNWLRIQSRDILTNSGYCLNIFVDLIFTKKV